MPLNLCVCVRRLGLLTSPLSRLMSTATPKKNNKVTNKHLEFTADSTRQHVLAEARVTHVWNESPTVRCITLKINNPTFNFRAGQWVDMFIPSINTVGGFSIYSAPSQVANDGTLNLGIKFSQWPPAYWVHDQCCVGSEVMVRVGGDFYYAPTVEDKAHDLLLVGGGVGVNPLASIFLHAADLHKNAKEHNPGRILLLYSSKTYDELLYKEELNSIAENIPEMNIQYYTTREPPPNSTLATHGHINDQVIESAVNSLDRNNLKTFICGPPPMIEHINQLLLQTGLNQHQIMYEKWWYGNGTQLEQSYIKLPKNNRIGVSSEKKRYASSFWSHVLLSRVKADPYNQQIRTMATRRKAVRLTEEERGSQLSPLLSSQWSMVEGRDAIKKIFLFSNFNEAWGWMNRVALAGEKIDHHPEWFNVYNRVEVTWSTHDCGGLSVKDIKMATFCDQAYAMFKK